MNRQTRRMQASGSEDASTALPEELATLPGPTTAPRRRDRTSPAQFLREVRGELRKVAWPSRSEVTNYSAVVLITLVVIVAMIFAFNFAFAKGVTYLFQ